MDTSVHILSNVKCRLSWLSVIDSEMEKTALEHISGLEILINDHHHQSATKHYAVLDQQLASPCATHGHVLQDHETSQPPSVENNAIPV